jgi:hypothetical protein
LFWLIFQVGEIAKVTCKPEYAYGSSGSPPEYYSDIMPLTFFFGSSSLLNTEVQK